MGYEVVGPVVAGPARDRHPALSDRPVCRFLRQDKADACQWDIDRDIDQGTVSCPAFANSLLWKLSLTVIVG